jgi:predicted ATP-grasp superfamily ATP-dependent carboligase
MLDTSPTILPAFDTQPDRDEPGALVFGGAHGSLAVVRSLGRHGIPVWLLQRDHPIAHFSRYASGSIPWDGPEQAGAVDRLLELGRRYRLQGAVLFPGGDAEAELVSRNHDRLAEMFRLTTPPWEAGQWAFDKRRMNQRAAELGIGHPWSYYPRDRQDVAELQCQFPVILKPTIKKGANAFTLAKAWRADDRAALLARYDQAAGLVSADAIVVQELIPGDGSNQFSYAGLWDRGAPIASLIARRTRQYPIDFGYTSTYVETVEQTEVEDAARRFLASIGYSGLVEVEFKYDRRDGRFKILDVNARPWTWNALGEIAGIDFPYLAWRLARGEPVAPVHGRAGAAWMHLSRDVVAAMQEILAGTLSPAGYLHAFHRPIRFAAFAGDDPVPGLVDLPIAVARVFTKRAPIYVRQFLKAIFYTDRRAAPSAQPRGDRT